MTKQEFDISHSLILLRFDLGDISEWDYLQQIAELAEKFGEEYEEGL